MRVNNTIPLFKSHYSIRRSILTLEKSGKSAENEPASIFDIAKKNNLDTVFIVDDSIGSMKIAYETAESENIKMIWGLRITCCDDSLSKDPEIKNTYHKIIIAPRNKIGYTNLIELYSYAAKDGFLSVPRVCEKILNKYSLDNIKIMIPFYDSFIFNNMVYGHSCLFSYEKYNSIFFIEESYLQFDKIVKDAVMSLGVKTEKARSVYYEKRQDFLPYLTYRCFTNFPLRTVVTKPDLDFFSSNEFCFENLTNPLNLKEV